MLGPHTYYWPNQEMGHSQPIATRSGWIALAIMPFMMSVVFILAFDDLAAYCGLQSIRHEGQFREHADRHLPREAPGLPSMVGGLYVYVVALRHLSNSCLLTCRADIASLVHTFPFIVMDVQMGTFKETYYGSSFYWTGFLSLVPQVCHSARVFRAIAKGSRRHIWWGSPGEYSVARATKFSRSAAHVSVSLYR
jgi:hypothetical protein